MVCCKLHLKIICWELEGAEHDTSIVSESKLKPFFVRPKNWMYKWNDSKNRERDYINMLRGRSRALKLSKNVLTDFTELRSSCSISTRADLFSSKMSCLASFAASMFLAAIMTWAFRRAKTRAVSKPIPLAPPAFFCWVFQHKSTW